jgi:hypothetical protein
MAGFDMHRLHLKHNLRSAVFLLVFLALLALPVSLWWVNRSGLPESWRATIERGISTQGAHLSIGGLTYIPFRGVVATRVRFFADPEKTHELSRMERVILDIDKTKLARGEFRLKKIQLSNARVSLPVDPMDPESATLELTEVHGTVLMPGGRLFEVREARGKVGGIDLTVSARLLGYQPEGSGTQDQVREGQRREFVAHIVRELEKWSFPGESAPAIRVFIDGDMTDRKSFTARFDLRADRIGREGHLLENVSAEGELTGDILTFSRIEAKDARGVFTGRADYDLDNREGRFDIQSTLDAPRLVKAWFGLPAPDDILIGGAQSLLAAGDFRLPAGGIPEVRATGQGRLESTMIKGVLFDAIESSFSWRDGDLFLRGIRLARPDGEARGKAMIQWPLVRMALQTTLPIAVYRPFFVGQPLEQVLDDFSETPETALELSLEGGFDANDPRSWAYTGGGTVRNVAFNGVPVVSATCRFALSHHELDFHNGTVVFNYRNYPLRKAHGGPMNATAKVGRIRYDAATNTVGVEDVRGSFWAPPMVRLFAPPLADSLEIYRFHRPPEMIASGIVDVTPRGRTSLDIRFKSPSPAEYLFLGENIVFTQASGKVKIQGATVTVNELELPTFGGMVAGSFLHNDKDTLSGGLAWTKLSLKDLASAYGVSMEGGGTFTGRIDFSMDDGNVATMKGAGHAGFEDAELFSVPVFGPLSTLVSGVLNDKRAGYQRAKNAYFSFDIDGGILSSRDFQTTTTSLVFTGDGSIDLRERTLDMNMRMNARGLLGFITLPLRPFYGLFQFRGSGPLRKPVWENAMFTPPPDPQKETLLKPPRAKIVRED